MKKHLNKLLSMTLALVMLVTLLSPNPALAKAKVALNKTTAIVTVGKTVKLKLNGTTKKVKWSSSNKKIATVSSSGKVKGKKAGTVTITAKCGKKKYKCKVKVKKAAVKQETETADTDKKDSGKKLIVIDPGHQKKSNTDTEPVGPGAKEKKAKVSSGTSGKASGLAEYELTLMVSLKLRDELEARGYEVIMTRTKHDVNLSNAERAEIANKAGADAFIRIHANGSDDSSTNGAMTICMTSKNPYNKSLYSKSKALSTAVLDKLVKSTGCKKQFVWETDTMSGINWAKVPVTIVEMGYMSNEKEDKAMATEKYQKKLATGIADGIDAYFKD